MRFSISKCRPQPLNLEGARELNGDVATHVTVKSNGLGSEATRGSEARRGSLSGSPQLPAVAWSQEHSAPPKGKDTTKKKAFGFGRVSPNSRENDSPLSHSDLWNGSTDAEKRSPGSTGPGLPSSRGGSPIRIGSPKLEVSAEARQHVARKVPTRRHSSPPPSFSTMIRRSNTAVSPGSKHNIGDKDSCASLSTFAPLGPFVPFNPEPEGSFSAPATDSAPDTRRIGRTRKKQAKQQKIAAAAALKQRKCSSVTGGGRLHAKLAAAQKERDHFAVLKDVGVHAFELGETLGTGNFARVRFVTYRKTSEDSSKKDKPKFYALKIMKKSEIVRLNQVERVLAEKEVLLHCLHPLIVPAYTAFQDEQHLYILMAFIVGGELFSVLRKNGRLDAKKTQFYSAEIVCALEYLHNSGWAYRDLKPENILLDKGGHIMMADFGCAKNLQKVEGPGAAHAAVPGEEAGGLSDESNIADSAGAVHVRTYTLCGTPEYVAPEIIQGKGYSIEVDWWALGILTYELLTGNPPFAGEKPSEIYKKTMKGKFLMPKWLNKPSKQLVKGLLQPRPEKRLGSHQMGGVEELTKHQFFENLDWKKCREAKLSSPYVPPHDGKDDTQNYGAYDEKETNTDKQVTIPDGIFDSF